MRLRLFALTLTLCGCVTTEQLPTSSLSEAEQKSQARIALGIGYLQQGNMSKARENLQIAVSHAPYYSPAQLALAHYYEQVAEPHSAEKIYRSALNKQPNNGHVLNNYGAFLCKQSRYVEADELFLRAIHQPNYYQIATSYENAALCALKAQHKQQAMNYFKRVLDYQPNRTRSRFKLAKLEIETGALSDARQRLHALNHQYGDQVEVLRLLVQLEQQAGNHALAEQYQRQLEQLD